MSFNYSGDPSTSRRDEVRFLIQDTDEACALLTDLEVDYVINKWMPLYNSTLFCASIAAAQVARKWTSTVNVTDSGSSVATGELQSRYTLMAQQLRAEYQDEGDIGGLINLDNLLADFSRDYDIEPLEFSMNIGDNPRTSRQMYGDIGDYAGYDNIGNDGVIL